MAQGKHGRNNTIESRLLIKGGNLAKLVPARRAPSAKPDMSTSDLHHSSPQARINRPLTPCKSLSCKLPRFGRVQAGGKKEKKKRNCFQTNTHVWKQTRKHADAHALSGVSLRGWARARANTQPFLDLFALPLRTAGEAVTLNQSETSLAG